MDYGIVTATFPSNNSPYTQVVSAQAKVGTFSLVNPAQNVYTAFLSSNQSGNPQTNDDVPLPPGASVVLDGTQDTFVYTAAQGQSAVLYKIPSGTQYNSGNINVGTVSGNINVASVAGSVNVNGGVNATGVGGFINPGQIGNLFNSGSTSIPASTTTSITGMVNVANYTSIVLSAIGLSNTSSAAGAAICAIFRLTWFDSLGDETAIDTVSMLLGASPGPNFQGPTWEIPIRGSSVVLSIQNVGTVGSITIPAGFVILDGSYRIVPNVRVTQGFIGAPLPALAGCSTFLMTSPAFLVASWIASLNYSYSAAVANMVIPLPQWAGVVTGFYQIITAALVRNMTIVDLTYAVQGGVVSGAGYTGGIILSIPGAIDANPVPISIVLPPTQCAVIIDNGAGPGSVVLSLIGLGNLYSEMDIHAMTHYEFLSLMLTIIGVMMIPLVRAALGALRKATQNETILTELIREVREDRIATNQRLTWLEQNLWETVKNGPRNRR